MFPSVRGIAFRARRRVPAFAMYSRSASIAGSLALAKNAGSFSLVMPMT